MTALLRTVPFISVFLFGVVLTRTDGQGLGTVICNGIRCGFGGKCEEPLCVCKTELSVLARLDTTPALLYCKGACSVTDRTCPTSNTTCNTTEGTNTCDCSPGYTRATSGHCLRNDDQCSSEPCGQNSVCTNTPGSFTCTCQTGFTSNTTSTLTGGCSDIDECTPDGSICGNNSTCTNSPGSFTCTCESGFTRRSISDVTKGCVDVNECNTSRDICGENSVCENTPGSFYCTCKTGFTPRNTSDLTQGCSAITPVENTTPMLTTARTESDSSSTAQRAGSVGSTASPSVTKGIHSSRKTESTGPTLPVTAEGASPSTQAADDSQILIIGLASGIGGLILLIIIVIIICVITRRRQGSGDNKTDDGEGLPSTGSEGNIRNSSFISPPIQTPSDNIGSPVVVVRTDMAELVIYSQPNKPTKNENDGGCGSTRPNSANKGDRHSHLALTGVEDLVVYAVPDKSGNHVAHDVPDKPEDLVVYAAPDKSTKTHSSPTQSSEHLSNVIVGTDSLEKTRNDETDQHYDSLYSLDPEPSNERASDIQPDKTETLANKHVSNNVAIEKDYDSGPVYNTLNLTKV